MVENIVDFPRDDLQGIEFTDYEMAPDAAQEFLLQLWYRPFGFMMMLHADKIEFYDIASNQVLKEHRLEPGEKVAEVLSAEFNSVFWKGENGRTYQSVVELVGLQHSAPTVDEYVLELQYHPELGLGAHFGWYGWGLFQVKANQIQLLFSQQVDKLSTGGFIQQGKNVVIFTGFWTGVIQVFELNASTDPASFNVEKAKRWEVNDWEALRALRAINGQLISAYDNGFIKVRDLDTSKVLNSQQVSKDPVNCLAYDKDLCYLGMGDGSGVALDLKSWSVQWKTKLSEIPLTNCAALNGTIGFADEEQGLFLVDPQTGNLVNQLGSYIGILSNPVPFKDWVLAGGAGNLWVFSQDRVIEGYHWEDNVIRATCQVPNGVILGNDNGDLSLWTYPGITVKPCFTPPE